jgi:hypothetical protein
MAGVDVMRYDPLFLLWTVHCPSAEDCSSLQQWLLQEIAPETILVNEVRATPVGIETRRREPHRLGDYFDSVQVLPSPERAPASFRLLFRRRPAAPRFWKDLMVRILQKLRDEAAQTTTTLEYRGDQEPDVLLAGQ